jgi:hypothetical protein
MALRKGVYKDSIEASKRRKREKLREKGRAGENQSMDLVQADRSIEDNRVSS